MKQKNIFCHFKRLSLKQVDQFFLESESVTLKAKQHSRLNFEKRQFCQFKLEYMLDYNVNDNNNVN